MSPRSPEILAPIVAVLHFACTCRGTRGQALADYVLLFSAVVIVCILALAVIGQAIPWATIVDGFRSLR
jgi:hypothetical protein